MSSWASAPTRGHLRRHHVLQGLLAWYVALWVLLAIAPVDRRDWFLENLLAVSLVAILAATYRWFPLSDLSYLLITVFLTLHAIGAHYTYAQVPLGFWMKDALGLLRNHFDRIAHFAFGLLLTYPVREVFRRITHLRGAWSYLVPITTVMAMSGLFEIVETWIAQIVSPELGDAYLGTQGDIWDAQNDMTCALAGTLLAAVAIALITRNRSPERTG